MRLAFRSNPLGRINPPGPRTRQDREGRVPRGEQQPARQPLGVHLVAITGGIQDALISRGSGRTPVGGVEIQHLLAPDHPQVIIFEASLSFLGLGIQQPDVSWGLMLSDARQYITKNPSEKFTSVPSALPSA